MAASLRGGRAVERLDHVGTDGARHAIRSDSDLHPDLVAFFGTYWSCSLAALHHGEVVYLSFFENEERERRARADWAARPEEPVVVAHFMDDRWVRVDRRTAHVQIEEPGQEPCVVAPSLTEWLDELEVLATW